MLVLFSILYSYDRHINARIRSNYWAADCNGAHSLIYTLVKRIAGSKGIALHSQYLFSFCSWKIRQVCFK